MALPQLNEVLSDSAYADADPARKQEISDAYWKAYRTEHPDDSEWADAQQKALNEVISTRKELEDATPFEQRSLQLRLDAANNALKVGNAGRLGYSKEQVIDLWQSGAEDIKSRVEQLNKSVSLFKEDNADKLSDLREKARNGGVFGASPIRPSAPAPGTPYGAYAGSANYGVFSLIKENKDAYQSSRDKLSEEYGVEPEVIDSVIQHQLGQQPKGVSRDALGQFHLKDEVLVGGADKLLRSIVDSDLPTSVKLKLNAEAPARLALFQKNLIESVKKDHPELASEIKWTGDVSKDYQALDSMLNENRRQQLGGGFAEYGLNRAKQAARGLALSSNLPLSYGPGSRSVRAPLSENQQEAITQPVERAQKIQESVNQLSDYINQEKVRILGTNAATVASGIASGAESIALGAVTGGLGNAVISADRIKKAGTFGKVVLGGLQRGLNTTPIATIYGADQALQTYEQTGDVGLSALSGAIEGGITTFFGTVKLGGLEDIGSRLATPAARRAAGKSIARAWTGFGGSLVKDVTSEQLEELTITALDTLYVQSKINPGMTSDDLKKSLYDTVVSTLFATGPGATLSAAREQGTNLFRSTTDQNTEQLHAQADRIQEQAAAETNLPETETAGGTDTEGGAPGVAPRERMTRDELREAVDDRVAELEAVPEDQRNAEQQTELQVLKESTLDEVAQDRRIELTSPERSAEQVAEEGQRFLDERQQRRETAAPTVSEQTVSERQPAGDINFTTSDTTVMVRNDLGEPVSERPAKSFTATDPNNDSRAIGTLDGEKLQVTDIRSKKGGEKVSGTRFFERVVKAGQENGATQVEVNLQSADTRAVLKRLVEKGVLTNPRQETGISVDRHPTLFDITPATQELSTPDTGTTTETAPNEGRATESGVGQPSTQNVQDTQNTTGEPNTPQGVQLPAVPTEQAAPANAVPAGGTQETTAPAEAQAEAPLKPLQDINAPEELVGALADIMGIPRDKVQVETAGTQGELVQGELFQNPEAQGNPAASAYVRSFKGSPPTGASRAIIDYAGDPLLRNVDDLPAQTRKDIEEADQLIQQATGKKGRVKVGRVRFNDFLFKLWKRHHRGKKPGWQNFQDRRGIRQLGRVVAFEVAHALSKDGSGVDWYRGKVDRMYQTLSSAFPELSDPESKGRFFFSIILAATSNGQPVLDNLTDAIRIYRDNRNADLLPTKVRIRRSERSAAVNASLRDANFLIRQHGWEKAKQMMLEPVTVSHLKSEYGVEMHGEHADHTVIGAMLMGPKIGSFWGNLNGHYDSITMDLWFTRSMNRLSGDTATINPSKLATHLEALDKIPGVPLNVKKDIKSFLAALKADEGWTRIPSDIREELEALYDFAKTTNSRYSNGGYKDKSPVNKTVQKFLKELDGGEDAPDNGTHRKWMRDVIGAAQEQLKKTGVEISNADLQAVLWFHEKDLYTRFGATSSRGERADYASAAEPALGRNFGEGTGNDPGSSPGVAGPTGPAAAGTASLGFLDEVPRETKRQMEERLRREREGTDTLYQNQDQGPKGQVTFKDTAQALITLFKSSDQSTAIHEMAHVARRFLFNRDIPQENRLGITDEDIDTAEKWAGVKDGVWDRNAEEKFARGFERYIRDGKFPENSALQELFQKMSQWLKAIYQTVSNSSLNVQISPEMRQVFDKLVTRGERIANQTPAAPKPAPAKKRLPPSTTTSLKNAATDRTLRENGMEPILGPARQSNEETWERSMAVVSKNPELGAEIVRDIQRDGRSVRDEVEEGVLLHELASRKAAVARARNRVNRSEPGSEEQKAAQRSMEEAEAELYAAIVAAKLAGTAWGRIGQFRQRFINEDFSLEAMESRFRADVLGGAPLSAADRAYVAEMQKKITEAEEARKQLEQRVGELERQAAAYLEKERAKLGVEAAKVRKPPKEKQGDFTRMIKQKAQAARSILDRFRSLKQEPETLRQDEEMSPEELEAFAAIGAEYLLDGHKDFIAFSKKLSNEFPGAMPYVRAVFNAAQKSFRGSSNSSRTKTPMELFNTLDIDNPEIDAKLVYRMARGFINQGYEDTDVLDAVTELLQEKQPDLTREEVVILFTNYGKVKYPSQEEDLKKLRDLRNIERILAQIEDVKSGQLPKKTGQQRDPASLRVRELMKELKQAMKDAGLKHAVNKGQLRGSLDAIKSRFKNEIEELEKAIATRTPRVRERSQIEYDEETNQLKKRRDELKEKYNQLFGPKKRTVSDQQRLKNAHKYLTKMIAEEEAMLRQGILKRVKQKHALVLTPELQALRDKLDSMREARHAAYEALHPKKTPEQRAIERAVNEARKSIARYEEILRTQRLPDKRQRQALPADQALTMLLNQRNTLKKAVDALRKARRPRQSKEQRRMKAAESQLRKALAEVDRRIKTGDFAPKAKNKVSSPAIDSLRAQLKAQRAVLKALMDTGKPQLTPEEQRDQALIKASERRRAKIEARIKAGDYVKTKRIARKESAALAAARLAEAKAKEEWNRGFFEAKLKNRSTTVKLADGVAQTFNLARTLKTIADVSAVLRQGAAVFFSRPWMSVKAIPEMFLAGLSEVQDQRIRSDIENSKYYHLSQQAKLFLSHTGPDDTQAKVEEAFRGRWARQIPGLNKVVNFSERTYNAYLNKVRIGHFEALVNAAGGDTVTVKEARIIADFVNKATGRGNLRSAENSAAALATIFFSPKFVVSRFQLIAGVVPATFDLVTGAALRPADVRRAKRAIAREYARMIFGIASVYTLDAMAKSLYGDDDEEWMEIDPRSSKFGRIRIGNTYIDPMGGMLQAATFLARMTPHWHEGEFGVWTKTGAGEVVTLRRPGFGKQSYKGVLGRFLQSKLSPIPATAIELFQGEDVVGNVTTPTSGAISLFPPLVVGDIWDIMKEDNKAAGVPLSVLVAFGLGVQVHNDENLSFEQEAAVKLYDLTGGKIGDERSVFDKKTGKKTKYRYITR